MVVRDQLQCETPKSPPGDYNLALTVLMSITVSVLSCETPKSPPGDYNSRNRCLRPSRGILSRCETPKSPPGDYNQAGLPRPQRGPICVKHLNPRQGITTEAGVADRSYQDDPLGVKHLNPRQGITTGVRARISTSMSIFCVKHLNPRQGITTSVEQHGGRGVIV